MNGALLYDARQNNVRRRRCSGRHYFKLDHARCKHILCVLFVFCLFFFFVTIITMPPKHKSGGDASNKRIMMVETKVE
ncbi:hypothetical protein LDENG_00214410 [Lucifuga dentata]|nr:hypothetical protein LDENG_00214410 [Lucifuga dentata]